MLEMSEGLRMTLMSLREEWAGDDESALGKEELRKLIEDYQIGHFIQVSKMDKEEIADFLCGKTVAGVDGSSNSFGGSYPGMITLLQAGAMTMKRSKYLVGDALSPMSRRDRLRISEYRERYEISGEEAYTRYKDEQLACLEVIAANDMLNKESPAVVLFDGGFVRYESKASQYWEDYAAMSRQLGILSVGIIEEVGTNFIAKALQEHLAGRQLAYDRQLLFGVLEPGEVLLLNTSMKQKGFKGGYYTCFARLSAHPSIMGCDMFADQQQHLIPLLRFLYTNTLEGSRGVPFWIDRVDHEIKLSFRETEALIRHTFPPAWVEKFLVSQRSRRDI